MTAEKWANTRASFDPCAQILKFATKTGSNLLGVSPPKPTLKTWGFRFPKPSISGRQQPHNFCKYFQPKDGENNCKNYDYR